MILACTILVNDSALILPSLLFVGIIFGIIKQSSLNATIMTSAIAFVLGSVITLIISLITIYYTYGGLYAIIVIQTSYIYITAYTLIGCIGSSIGYYINEELF